MPSGTSFIVFIIVITLIMVTSSIIIFFAIRFQNKKTKKYNELKNIIKKKGNVIFQVKDSLTPDEINNIDSSIDVNTLMTELYNTYINLEDKMKNLNPNIDNLITGYLKKFYINKINSFKQNGYSDVKDDINLVGYSITDFKKNKLKFRININCFSYKTINNKIVSGSNSSKVEQIILLTYKKINDKWLISEYEKLYEKKLS